MQVFSLEWVAAYQTAMNSSAAYAEAGKHWELGPVALQLNGATPIAVLLDLKRGRCEAATSLTPTEDALASATFVIAGDAAAWQEVLGGQTGPLMAIMRGKLKLVKGSLAKLIPYTNAAVEMVNSAQGIPTEF